MIERILWQYNLCAAGNRLAREIVARREFSECLTAPAFHIIMKVSRWIPRHYGSKGGDGLNIEEFSKPVVACFARFYSR